MSNPRFCRFETSLAGPATKHGEFSCARSDSELRLDYRSHETPFVLDADGFFEGLWRGDCGELFVLQPKTRRYLEINLAPNGAWWSCVFTAVRTRDESIQPPQLEDIRSKLGEHGWEAGFSISFAEIERCLGSVEDLRGNVTLILGGCPDPNPPLENLHSVALLGAVDFHRPHEWTAFEDLLN